MTIFLLDTLLEMDQIFEKKKRRKSEKNNPK